MKNIKAYIAECIGTFVLVFCGCGVAALTDGELVSTALAFGFSIVAMAYAIGRISGCHLNPAVSFAMLITKKMPAKDFGLYVLAQLIGGLLGGALVWGVAQMSGGFPAGVATNHFVNNTSDAAGICGALLIEIALTFIFVFVILNVTDEKNAGVGKKGGLIIGLTLALVHLIGIPFTGTSVNPVRSLAAAICDGMFTKSTDSLSQVWLFLVAPMIGAAIAALVFKALNNKKEA